MKEIRADERLVARCGLYCGACKAYLKGRCPGCRDNVKAGWCKIRACCAERSLGSCAECQEFVDPHQCAKFNNLIAKVIGVVLNSDRRACVAKLRESGPADYAAFMARRGLQTMPRRGPKPQ